MPFSVRELDLDLCCGGSVKWLCGGPGAGYLYCKPELRERLEPAITGWMAHEHPFAFEKGPQKYAHDATRLLHGSPAVPALYAARSGYELILQAGCREHPAQVDRADAALPAARRGGGAHEPVTAGSGAARRQRDGAGAAGRGRGRALAERDILVDCRPDVGAAGLAALLQHGRELDRCLDAVVEILRTKAWEKFAQKGTAY